MSRVGKKGEAAGTLDVIAGRHFLAVSDDDDTLESIAQAIHNAGGYVDPASSARIGLGKLSLGDYEVVISDAQLDPQSGLKLLETAREWNLSPQAKWVIVSAACSIAQRLRAEELGAYPLRTPATPPELMAFVRQLLTASAPTTALASATAGNADAC